MSVVSVINYKGGVGKTTLTANLGAELAYRGYKVLLLDMDAQASLTFSLVKPDDWEKSLKDRGTILEWYESFDAGHPPLDLSSIVMTPAAARNAIKVSGRGGRLDLIPSHLGLINVDLELATALGGSNLKQAKLNYLRVHRRLADGLSQEFIHDYDLILIDCPPNFNIVTKTAIVASDYVLIPAKADYLSTLGISYLHRSLNELVSTYNEYVDVDSGKSSSSAVKISPEVLGVVFTMMQFYGGQPIAALRPFMKQTKELGVPVFKGFMRENKSIFADAPEYGVPVALGKNSSSSRPIVSELEQLVMEFEQRVGL